MYINFSSAGATSQLTLPKGGASIVVVVQENLPGRDRLSSSPSEWAVSDARGVASGSPSIRELEMPEESGGSRAILSSYNVATFSPDEQPQHCVAIFFEFDKKLFAAHLTYVANDRNGPAIEYSFVSIIRSIRPEKTPKR